MKKILMMIIGILSLVTVSIYAGKGKGDCGVCTDEAPSQSESVE